jgi:hypothetical protein
MIAYDVRPCGMSEEESLRAIRRIAGAWGRNGKNSHSLDRIIIIGQGFFFDEEI